MSNTRIQWEDFAKIDLRIGTIVSAEVFKEARKPAYKLIVDFGMLGLKKTSAQITVLYDPETLIGRQVVGVLNFAPKQIANMMSECLILGGIGEEQQVTLLQPERAVKNGTKIG